MTHVGRYHEYIEGVQYMRGDIMVHVGELIVKSQSIDINNATVINIPEIYLRYSHKVLINSPMYSRYPFDVLNTHNTGWWGNKWIYRFCSRANKAGAWPTKCQFPFCSNIAIHVLIVALSFEVLSWCQNMTNFSTTDLYHMRSQPLVQAEKVKESLPLAFEIESDMQYKTFFCTTICKELPSWP